MNLHEFKNCILQLDTEKINQLKNIIDQFQYIIILGNGGSNSISSHIAQDYTKILGKRALSFSDSSRLSCYANDYGYDNAYKEFLNQFATLDTLIILISSSGNSKNILNAAEFCINKFPIITLSGFSKSNKLKSQFEKESLIHFHVDSEDYGIVECMHLLILHSVI